MQYGGCVFPRRRLRWWGSYDVFKDYVGRVRPRCMSGVGPPASSLLLLLSVFVCCIFMLILKLAVWGAPPTRCVCFR